MNKKDMLSTAVEKFEKSSRSAENYLDLFIALNRVIKPCSGLLWADVQDVLEKVLDKNRDL